VFFTNYRVLCLSTKYVFDIPLCFIESNSVKTPTFASLTNASTYIQINIKKKINLLSDAPQYMKDNFSSNDLQSSNYSLPSYAMIKFKDKHFDMNKSNEILSLAIKSKEYNIQRKKKEVYENLLNKQNQNNDKEQYEGLTAEEIENAKKLTRGKGLGLTRVQNAIKQNMEKQSEKINSAFTDITSLKSHVKEMISLAQIIRSNININAKIEDANSKEINSVLSKIGFVDPVTKEVSGSEYYVKLAEQINEYFDDYFKKNPKVKVITLIDAYCVYNRARGGNTISPKDMKQALDNFKNVTQKVMWKNYNNEMIVLHTKDYSNENILEMVKKFMTDNKKKSINGKELAEILNVGNVILEKILIEDMLKEGYLLEDESDLDVVYYQNYIKGYKME
jgi:hypothetical protein